MKKNKKGSNVIGSKLNDYVNERIDRLCEKKGFTRYELIQMACDCFVRYMDDAHNLSEDMERMMAVFEHMNGWHNAFSLGDPTVGREISEAFYVQNDPTAQKHGFRVTWVQKPYFGDWQQSENVLQILERVLWLLIPERYDRMRRLATDMGCYSILELIDRLIDAQTFELLNQELRADFEDCNRSDWGKKVEYGQRTKRVHRRTIDSLSQPTIHFEPDDVPEDNSLL